MVIPHLPHNAFFTIPRSANLADVIPYRLLSGSSQRSALANLWYGQGKHPNCHFKAGKTWHHGARGYWLCDQGWCRFPSTWYQSQTALVVHKYYLHTTECVFVFKPCKFCPLLVACFSIISFQFVLLAIVLLSHSFCFSKSRHVARFVAISSNTTNVMNKRASHPHENIHTNSSSSWQVRKIISRITEMREPALTCALVLLPWAHMYFGARI